MPIMLMNFSNRTQLLNLYTDVKIVLQDETQTKTLNLHKIILSHASDYFSKLFTFKDSEEYTQ